MQKSLKICALLALIVLALIACGEANNNTGSSTTTTSQPQQEATQHFKVKQTVKVGDAWQVTVNGAKTSKGSEFLKPKSGHIYLLVDVSLKNLSNKEQSVSSALNFTLADSTGVKYNETIVDSDQGQVDGKVEAGGPLKGMIAYEVPTTEHKFTFAFAPDLLSSGQTIWDLAI